MKTKIILETGCNHNGSIELAKQMIDEAKELNVWCIKFQKRDIDSIDESIRSKQRSLSNSFGKTYEEHRRALEFSIDQIKFLKEYSESRGLKFCVSIFDEVSLDQMIDLNIEYIKLPSQLSSDSKLIRKIHDQKKDFQKLILSTGMHTLNEIKDKILTLGADIVLYCRSIYPCEIDQIHFKGLRDLIKNSKETEIGYSSHDKSGKGLPNVVLLGAKYIERHYTISKSLKGSDHKTVSSDFSEIKEIIKNIKNTEELLEPFNFDHSLLSQEEDIRRVYRGK